MNTNIDQQLEQVQKLQQLTSDVTHRLKQSPSLNEKQALEMTTLLMDLLEQVRQMQQEIDKASCDFSVD